MVLTRKLPFYWLTFIVTKGATGPERQKSSADLFILNYNKVKHDETYLVMQRVTNGIEEVPLSDWI